MSGKPFALVRIDDLASHLRSTMARGDPPASRSMRQQLAAMVSHFLRQRLAGHAVIYPGMAKMAKWGGCSERQARENFARLRAYGVVIPVSYVTGGRRSTRFTVCLQAIGRLLVVTGANPSQVLLDKLREAGNPEPNPEENPEAKRAKNPEEKPAKKPEPTSAGIHTGKGAPQKGRRKTVATPRLRLVNGGRGDA